MMPTRAPWEPAFNVGHALIDAQHQGLLAQCERLADLCEAAGGAEAEREFDAAFERLRALARSHFEAEAALLASRGDADLESHRDECDEFEYLADEIATTDHFDRLELQRFATLWFIGHISAAARRQREPLAGEGDAASS